ncbi:MAG: diguanylate cyclase [Nitrosomonadales bacterium]|nr:diguanylate cyclase [Nitrosomonadales bacterium]
MPFIVRSVVLVVAYLVAAEFGMVFGTAGSSVTIFWPSAGIALAALLLGGLRYLPAIFLAEYLAAVSIDAPLLYALGASLGNTLETYIGYLLLTRVGRVDLSLGRVRDLFMIILLGGLIPTIVSAALGPLTLLASGGIVAENLAAVMWRWWRADVLGVAFITPLILVFARGQTRFFKRERVWEMVTLWAVSFCIGQNIFLGWSLPLVELEQPLGLAWAFPALFWAGLRTGRRNTGLIQLLFVLQALASAYLHKGYFADDFAQYGLANFWMFSMLIAALGMSLAVLSSAQRRTMHRLALNAKVFAVSNDGIVITDADSNILEVNPAFTALTGYTREDVIGKNPRLLASGRQSREFYADMWKSLVELGHWQGEVWNRRKNGAAYLEKLSIHTLLDEDGRPINRIGIFADITLSKAEQETVAHQAQHDCLTNLPNRLLFRDRFNQQLAMSRRYAKKFAVIYIDLDQFKPVNDRLGHQMGDHLLVAVADKLLSLVREIDTVSRFGGDEFAILVSEVNSRDDVTNLAEKILVALSEPFDIDDHVISVTASLGIAVYPDDGTEMEPLLRHADAAMYQAKRRGSNTYC